MSQSVMVKVVRITETSIYFHDTARRHILDGCHLYDTLFLRLIFPKHNLKESFKLNYAHSFSLVCCLLILSFSHWRMINSFSNRDHFCNYSFSCKTGKGIIISLYILKSTVDILHILCVPYFKVMYQFRHYDSVCLNATFTYKSIMPSPWAREREPIIPSTLLAR
jgi:hypothetical protein